MRTWAFALISKVWMASNFAGVWASHFRCFCRVFDRCLNERSLALSLLLEGRLQGVEASLREKVHRALFKHLERIPTVRFSRIVTGIRKSKFKRNFWESTFEARQKGHFPESEVNRSWLINQLLNKINVCFKWLAKCSDQWLTTINGRWLVGVFGPERLA